MYTVLALGIAYDPGVFVKIPVMRITGSPAITVVVKPVFSIILYYAQICAAAALPVFVSPENASASFGVIYR